MTPYPDTKPSGVDWLGEVPAHWRAVRARFLSQVNPPSDRYRALPEDAEVSFVPMDAVGEYGGLRLNEVKPKEEIGASYTEFEEGDVVVAKITPCFENGKGAFAEGLANGAARGTTELHVVRASGELNRRFLFWITISQPFRSTGEAEMIGAGGQKRITTDFVKDFRVPLPPLDEQRTIARYLDAQAERLDALVEVKRTFLERLAEKRTALITRAVTRGLPPETASAAGFDPAPALQDSGVDWLAEVPAHWEVKRVSYVVTKVGSGKTPSGGAKAYDTEGIPFLRSQNIYADRLHLDDVVFISEDIDRDMENSRVEEGDVLLNITGASLGRSAIAPEGIGRANVNQHVCIIRPIRSRVEPHYLQMVLSSEPTQAQIFSAQAGSSREGLNFQQVRALVFGQPPLAEQRAIVRYLDRETARIDALAATVETALERLGEYRQALITAAVTGRIDVRDAAPMPAA